MSGTSSFGGTANVGGLSGVQRGQPGRHFVGRFAHGGITGAAGGGPRGGLTMLAEEGRELVELPAGSRVHSNPDTERMLSGDGGGGGAVNLTINVGGTGSGGLDRALKDWIVDTVQVVGGGDVQVAFGTRG